MQRPGFYFCICPDAGLIKGHIARLQEDFPATPSQESAGLGLGLMPAPSAKGTRPASAWERHVYWGNEELPSSFWENLLMQGLFGTPKLLILRHAEQIPAAQWKEISSALAKPNPLSWLIICLEGSWEKGQAKIPAHIQKQASLLFAEKKAWTWRHGGLDFQKITQYIQSKASTFGISFAPHALQALSNAVPPDATAIDHEMEKLRLCAVDGKVTTDMVGAGSYIPESDIFSFMNSVLKGNIPAAWKEIYRSQHDPDALLFPFLALLTREARLLWQILSKEPVRLHPSSARDKELCAQRLGFSGVTQVFHCIAQAELYIKSGERTVEQTLEALVAELSLLFKPKK